MREVWVGVYGVDALDSEALLSFNDVSQHSLQPKPTGTEVLHHIILGHLQVLILLLPRVKLEEDSARRVDDLVQRLVELLRLLLVVL